MDSLPEIWIGHVVLEGDRIPETADFMLGLGIRSVFRGPAMAIFELRGGTHLRVARFRH
jgi:hypothetical protein